jgi:anti-sigma regulatory factor (Ser/Thr protein kinase)
MTVLERTWTHTVEVRAVRRAMPVAVDETRSFLGEADSVRLVRQFIRESLQPLDQRAIDDAILLAGEVAANVVEHVRTAYEVRVVQREGWARVEVRDGSSVLPAVQDLAEDSDRGRGLVLIKRLAAAWGVEARPGGKCVWFELR